MPRFGLLLALAVDALDLVRWEYARPESLVQGLLDYYAVAIGASAAVASPLFIQLMISLR